MMQINNLITYHYYKDSRTQIESKEINALIANCWNNKTWQGRTRHCYQSKRNKKPRFVKVQICQGIKAESPYQDHLAKKRNKKKKRDHLASAKNYRILRVYLNFLLSSRALIPVLVECLFHS